MGTSNQTNDLVTHIQNYASKTDTAASSSVKNGRSVLDVRMLLGGDNCYLAKCEEEADMSKCHARCRSNTTETPYCRVETKISGEKVGECVECYAHNQCAKPPNLQCDNFTCQPSRISPKFLENDLKADNPP